VFGLVEKLPPLITGCLLNGPCSCRGRKVSAAHGPRQLVVAAYVLEHLAHDRVWQEELAGQLSRFLCPWCRTLRSSPCALASSHGRFASGWLLTSKGNVISLRLRLAEGVRTLDWSGLSHYRENRSRRGELVILPTVPMPALSVGRAGGVERRPVPVAVGGRCPACCWCSGTCRIRW